MQSLYASRHGARPTMRVAPHAAPCAAAAAPAPFRPASVAAATAPAVQHASAASSCCPQLASSSSIRSSPRRAVHAAAGAANGSTVAEGSVSVVLLAGGVGKRMGASIPKQYLKLRGREIATYSLEMFARMKEVSEIVIVCDPSWKDVFERCIPTLPSHINFKWALPGAERQDSVFNGLQQVRDGAALVAVHDSARPLVTPADASKCFADALAIGAAVLGTPVKPTIKEVDKDLNVIKTLQRAKLWEVQTPQVIRPELLRRGFELVKSQNLEVTDDVSIIEAMGLPVRITSGSYTNIKVTTPDDMSVAEKFLDEAQTGAKALA